MGYLTTITFRNDCYTDYKNNPEKLVEIVLAAIRDETTNNIINSIQYDLIIQKPVHSDDYTVLIQGGNTCISLTEEKLLKLKNNHRSYYDKLNRTLKYVLNLFKQDED